MPLHLCHGHALQIFHLHMVSTEVTMIREEYARLLYDFMRVDAFGAETSQLHLHAAFCLQPPASRSARQRRPCLVQGEVIQDAIRHSRLFLLVKSPAQELQDFARTLQNAFLSCSQLPPNTF